MSRLTLEHALAAAWQRRGAVAALLLPLGGLFALLSASRRAAYRLGLLRALRLPVPVVVVGNIIVGGAGKTPLVLHLAAALKKRGHHPAIVTRGYGGAAEGPLAVTPLSRSEEVGDEPLLLAQRSGCAVWMGRDRVAAARSLLARHPECDVVLCDDGLQHYRLARDIEIAVVDERGLGNGWLLPAGPLRESASRLGEVDALVINAGRDLPLPSFGAALFRMSLRGDRFHALRDPSESRAASQFAGIRLQAVAAIGHPRRFFDHLRALGLDIVEHPFPDHHRFTPADLAFAPRDIIVMTEKDAVKCAHFAPANTWVLPVDALVEPDLGQWLSERLHGRAPA